MKKKVFFLVLISHLFSCTTGDIEDLKFSVIQENNSNTKAWTKIEGIPKFDVNIHSDGCSGGMSAIYSKLEFLHEKNGKRLQWRHCCEIHDKAYYYGGTKKQKILADEKLSSCVSQVVGNQFLGKAMQTAVEIGGGPYLPTSYRWGYGEDFRIE